MLDQRLQQLHRRRRLQRCLHTWAPLCAASCILAALVIISVHLLSSTTLWLDLPILAAALLLPLAVLPRCWAKRDNLRTLSAHLDVLCQGKGLCMALASHQYAQRDADWMARLRQPLENCTLPPFDWSQAKFLPIALLCLLFSLFTPQASQENITNNHFTPFFQSLLNDAQAMHELGIIDQPTLNKHREKIKELEQQAHEKGMSQALWQARDNMHAEMNALQRNAAQRLAEAINAARNASNEETGSETLQELAAALANLAIEHKDMLPQLNKNQQIQLARMANMIQHQLNPEQLQALQQQMQRAGNQHGKKLKQPLNQQQRKKFAYDLLKRLGAEGEGLQAQFGINMNSLVQQIDNSNIQRGPGHVQLRGKDPTQTERGNIQGLIPGARVNPDGSITIAEEYRDADIDQAARAEAVRAGAKQFNPTAVDSRRNHTALRHRSAIERYFVNRQQQAPIVNADTPANTNTQTVIPVEEDEVDIP